MQNLKRRTKHGVKKIQHSEQNKIVYATYILVTMLSFIVQFLMRIEIILLSFHRSSIQFAEFHNN